MTTPEILTLIGQILGFVAMALIVLSFQCKKPQGLFIVQIGSCCMFILSYLFLGIGGDPTAYSGMAQNAVGLLFRGALALSNKHEKLLSPLVLAMMGALGAMVAVFTYPYNAVDILDRIMPLLPVVANFACMGCMWTRNSNTIRIVQLVIISPFWLIYTASMGAWAGILTEVFNISSIGVYYLRMWREKKKTAATE